MKRLPLLVLAAVLVWFVPAAAAQLGETPGQCEVRYGKATEQWDDEQVSEAKCFRFEKDGLEIVVTFLGGQSAAIAFAKLDDTDLNEAEIQALLAANRGASSWGNPEYDKKPGADGKPDAEWERVDKGASASYEYDEESKQRSLDIETATYSQAWEAAEEQKKHKHKKH